jgi:putative transposase
MACALELAPQVGMKLACSALGLARGALARERARQHRENFVGPQPPCAKPARPRPPLALTTQQIDLMLATLNSERFLDTAPAAVHATLLDEGRYLGSVRTMYRYLSATGGSPERRRQRVHPPYAKPELLATRPNEVWSWDITKLKGPAKWTCFHLYVILDIYSRLVVGWMIADRECSVLASQFIATTAERHGIAPGTLTLHADRGTSMRAKTLADLLVDLNIARSHSRPHVSDDNPYSESQFKTMKYRPEFPPRFGCIEDARLYCQRFFDWYNFEHRHSGIGYMTPHNLHSGQANAITAIRHRALDAAFLAHPERFKNQRPQPPAVPTAAWINPPKKEPSSNTSTSPSTLNS